MIVAFACHHHKTSCCATNTFVIKFLSHGGPHLRSYEISLIVTEDDTGRANGGEFWRKLTKKLGEQKESTGEGQQTMMKTA